MILGTICRFLDLYTKLPDGTFERTYNVDWNCTDGQLVKEFAEWLRSHRPAGTLSHHKGIKLNSLRVNLERLGIMRLLHHHSGKEIRSMFPQAAKLLSNRPDYFKDRKKALAVFNSLFPPEHNDQVKPLSWATKSGKSK